MAPTGVRHGVGLGEVVGREVTPLAQQVAACGFTVVGPTKMRRVLEACGGLTDAAAFAASWDDLPLDAYMADGGRYRRRRHAVYAADADGGFIRQPHQPHYQTRRDNPLNGGIARWFAPVAPAVGAGATLRSAAALLAAVAGHLHPTTPRWRAEVHQFRIDARAGEAGRPTPEGMHRDGVDVVLVMLVGVVNAAHGVSHIADAEGVPLFDIRLTRPFEAVVLDDHRVRHGVSPIEPIDQARAATRDVLVVTLTAAP